MLNISKKWIVRRTGGESCIGLGGERPMFEDGLCPMEPGGAYDSSGPGSSSRRNGYQDGSHRVVPPADTTTISIPTFSLDVRSYTSQSNYTVIEDYYGEDWDYGEAEDYDYIDAPFFLAELEAAETPLPLSPYSPRTGAGSPGFSPQAPLQQQQTLPLPPTPSERTHPSRPISHQLQPPKQQQPSPLLPISPPSPLQYFRRRKPKAKGDIPPFPPRPASFYSSEGSTLVSEMTRTRRERFRYSSTSEENATSPVALPHKALALLGIKEQSGFGTPASPKSLDNSDLFEIATDSEEEGNYWQGSRRQSKISVVGRQAPPPYTQSALPDRIYFRPQSIYSSFTTSSSTHRTISTTITTVTASSRNSRRRRSGARCSDSHTLRGKSMLNLEDSDDEAPPIKRKPAPNLPPELMLQICAFFSSPTHHADLPTPAREASCPNCNLTALWSLALVSRSWHTAANATLYTTIPLDFGTFTPTTRSASGLWIPPQYSPFTTHPHLHNTTVHHRLPLLYRSIWDSAGAITVRTLYLKLPRRLFSVTKYPLSAILPKCSNLQTLDAAITSGAPTTILPILATLPHITHWTWPRETAIKAELAVVTAQHPARKTSIRFGLQRSLKSPTHTIFTTLFPLWSRLKHLELVRLRRSVEFPEDFDFAAMLPGLRSLALRHVDDFVDRRKADEIPGLLQKMPLTLSRLELEGCAAFITPMRIRQYLRQARQGALRTLVLRDMRVDVVTLNSILCLAPAVRELVVVESEEVEEERGVGIRGELPELRELRSVGVRMCNEEDTVRFVVRLLHGGAGVRVVTVGCVEKRREEVRERIRVETGVSVVRCAEV